MELNVFRTVKGQTKLKKNSIYDFFKFRRGGFEDKVLINLIYSLGLIVFFMPIGVLFLVVRFYMEVAFLFSPIL